MFSEKQSCDRCGSAGSIEFEMCQVCYKDYSKAKESGMRGLKSIGYNLIGDTQGDRPLVLPVSEGMEPTHFLQPGGGSKSFRATVSTPENIAIEAL